METVECCASMLVNPILIKFRTAKSSLLTELKMSVYLQIKIWIQEYRGIKAPQDFNSIYQHTLFGDRIFI